MDERDGFVFYASFNGTISSVHVKGAAARRFVQKSLTITLKADVGRS